MIRPTAIINIDVDESVYDEEETPVELRRSYLYVAPLRVTSHSTPAAPVPAENVMRLNVKLRNPYWNSEDEGADDIWNDIMIPWLDSKLLKLENTVLAFNRRKKKEFSPTMDYGHLELVMGDVALSMKNYTTSEFPNAIELVERYRALINEGILKGLEIERVEMPWIDPESYVVEETEAPVDEIEADAEVLVDEASTEKSTEVATAAETAEAPEDETVSDDDEDEEYIDFTVWEITETNGTKRRFDSVEGVWL